MKRTKSPNKKEKRAKIPVKQEIREIEKQVIFITSRVHPGESNASWMVEGLMEMLLNPKPEEEELVKNLKDYFEFYIIPMINVDGVINGNYRCSLAACDLNRKYLKPSRTMHPCVYYLKKLCETITGEGKSFFLYLDMHGHSAKKNIF
jgi:murein tripeptide amidase MpaA